MADTHPTRPTECNVPSKRAGLMARAFLFFGPTQSSGSGLVRRWFRIRRMLAVATVVFLIGLTALAWVARSQANRAPTWWAPPVRTATCEASAERLEQSLVNRTHEVRPQPRWTITLDEADVNAWLATRLNDWMAAQVPPVKPGPFGQAQAMFRSGRIYVAAQVTSGTWEGKIVTAGIEPQIVNGALVLELRSATVGRLALPFRWFLGFLPEPRPGAGVTMDKERGRAEIAAPVLRLADGRVVRLEAVRVGEGTLTLEAETAR